MRAPAIPKKSVDTPFGRIAYLEAGPPTAPPVLLVHGIPTSSYLWRHVMARLAPDFRCLAPDLMGLGDTLPAPGRPDFTMPAQAQMLEAFLAALGVERAHVVAHDQGGAAAQILVAERPQRVDRLVLSDCVCFDNWPVPAIRQLMQLARLPWLSDFLGRTGIMELIETRTPFSRMRRGVTDPSCLSAEVIAEYLRPVRGDAGERERFRQFLLAGSPRYTMAVVPLLRELRVPTLILWAADDRYIPVSWGQKLFETIPGARALEIIPDAGHFWPEEKPAEFAASLARFLGAPLAAEVPHAVGPPLVELRPTKAKKVCPASSPVEVKK